MDSRQVVGDSSRGNGQGGPLRVLTRDPGSSPVSAINQSLILTNTVAFDTHIVLCASLHATPFLTHDGQQGAKEFGIMTINSLI